MAPGQTTLEYGTGTLADLLADARAIPKAAYGASRRVIDLAEPARQAVLTIPAAAATLVEHAEHAFADYLR
jgi:hypothetical protein